MRKELKKVVKGLIKEKVEIPDNLSAADVASDPVLLSARPGTTNKSKQNDDGEDEDSQSSSADSVERTKYKEDERQYLALVYTGQKPELKIPIEQNDD